MKGWRGLALGMGLWLVACDGGGAGADGGALDGARPDGSTGVCVGATDGTPCGDGQVCFGGLCVASECGDGILDERTEVCDDGNSVAFDGCEPTCEHTCVDDATCDDALACNGAETCDLTTHTCEAGSTAMDGTSCAERGVTDGICREGTCVPAGCGNGVVEDTEECDDGNTTAGDGCENDCRFSCTSDAQCSDGDPCDGEEVCDDTNPMAPVCAAGTPVTCAPSDACHVAACDSMAADPTMPCVESRIDADGDGESPSALGACGTDCNDDNPLVNAAATEICGNGVDDDCNPATLDSATTTYYVDCDLDGYATNDTGAVTACEMPTTRPCPGSTGGWTARLPSGAANIDCDNFNTNVRPNQTSFFVTSYTPSAGGAASFDYNCNMTTSGADRQFNTVASSTCELTLGCTRPPCSISDLFCSGTSGWSSSVPGCGAASTYRTCTRTPSNCRWDGRQQDVCTLVCDPASRDCCIPGSLGCNVNGTLRDTYCTPGASTCPITCTPNSRDCTWRFIGCPFASTTRTQGCR